MGETLQKYYNFWAGATTESSLSAPRSASDVYRLQVGKLHRETRSYEKCRTAPDLLVWSCTDRRHISLAKATSGDSSGAAIVMVIITKLNLHISRLSVGSFGTRGFAIRSSIYRH
jgi:hypothetical protein